MKIYISIPISGKDYTSQCFLAADIANAIRSLGHEPVNPFDTPHAPPGMTEREKYAYYMGEDLKRVLLCDAIFMCHGWAASRGCKIELCAAAHCGMKQYYTITQIPSAK